MGEVQPGTVATKANAGLKGAKGGCLIKAQRHRFACALFCSATGQGMGSGCYINRIQYTIAASPSGSVVSVGCCSVPKTPNQSQATLKLLHLLFSRSCRTLSQ